MDERGPVTVLLARFEDLVEAGLRSLIGEDSSLRVVASDVALGDLDAAITEHAPRVALLNFGSLRSPGEIRRLSAAHPADAAHRPRQPPDARRVRPAARSGRNGLPGQAGARAATS